MRSCLLPGPIPAAGGGRREGSRGAYRGLHADDRHRDRGKQFPMGSRGRQGPSGLPCLAWLTGGRGAAPKASCPLPEPAAAASTLGTMNTNGANRDMHSARVTTHNQPRARSLTPPEGACLARARLGSAASTDRAVALTETWVSPHQTPPTLWDSILGSVLSSSCRWPAGPAAAGRGGGSTRDSVPRTHSSGTCGFGAPTAAAQGRLS